MKYYIWSFEHNAWWAPNHCGYVHDQALAGAYDSDVAHRILEGANINEINEALIPITPHLAGKIANFDVQRNA